MSGVDDVSRSDRHLDHRDHLEHLDHPDHLERLDHLRFFVFKKESLNRLILVAKPTLDGSSFGII